jgi:hypothetical protein
MSTWTLAFFKLRNLNHSIAEGFGSRKLQSLAPAVAGGAPDHLGHCDLGEIAAGVAGHCTLVSGSTLFSELFQ